MTGDAITMKPLFPNEPTIEELLPLAPLAITKKLEYARKYQKTQKAREYQKKYRQSAEGKKCLREYQRKYRKRLRQ